jgi:hypothetical protein
MRSDRLNFVYESVGRRPISTRRPTAFSAGRLQSVDRLVIYTVILLTIGLLTGCSNSQVRRTPVTDLGEPWFCEMNETRDDWDCVRDEALARNPQPTRLPTDPVEQNPFDAQTPALPAGNGSREGLANPSAGIDFTAIEQSARTDLAASVLDRPPGHFAVQLTATETLAMADGFVRDHGLKAAEDVLTLELGRDDDLYYVVLLGLYETADDAQAAIDARPETLAEVKPWIRPLQSIQEGIRQAQGIHRPDGVTELVPSDT